MNKVEKNFSDIERKEREQLKMKMENESIRVKKLKENLSYHIDNNHQYEGKKVQKSLDRVINQIDKKVKSMNFIDVLNSL